MKSFYFLKSITKIVTFFGAIILPLPNQIAIDRVALQHMLQLKYGSSKVFTPILTCY